MNPYVLTIPFLSAFVGWITNVAAVRLLFWPVRPLRLPGLPWALHGVIPRRQAAIARSVGEMVERLLFRPEDMVQSLGGDRYEQEALHVLSQYLDERLEQGVNRYLPGVMRRVVSTYVKEALQREAARVTRAMMEHLRQRWSGDLRVAPTVAERVAALDPAEFEAMLLRVIGRELRWLEALGAVLGFVVGLVQMALMWRGASSPA